MAKNRDFCHTKRGWAPADVMDVGNGISRLMMGKQNATAVRWKKQSHEDMLVLARRLWMEDYGIKCIMKYVKGCGMDLYETRYENVRGHFWARYVFIQKLVLMKALEFVVQFLSNSLKLIVLTNTEVDICLMCRSFKAKIKRSCLEVSQSMHLTPRAPPIH